MKTLVTLLASAILSTSVSSFADTPSTHGMLLFGDNANYASHLPMFHHPHDYQVVLKIKFNELDDNEVLTEYKNAKAEHDGIFTLVPEPLDLTKIMDGSLTSFKADIFAGHFEQGGVKLGTIETVVDQLIYTSQLDPSDSSNILGDNYIVFGEQGEYYGAHIINSKPNFDAIVKTSHPLKSQPCMVRYCPDPVFVPVADNMLPSVLSSNKESPKDNLPAIGDKLGFKFFISATISETIYIEENELSH